MAEITTQSQYLIYLTEKGAINRYGTISDELRDKIRYELDVIIGKGFSEYFLILADIMQFCRKNEIPVGPSRGSAGGSIVSYCLYITEVDPVQFNLIFDRFLNPERDALPDIDTDLCWWRRQEVIEYVVDKYGDDKVAQIITFGTLSVKSLLDDLGRVLRVPKKNIESLKNLVPEGEKITLAKLIDNEDFMSKLHELGEKEPRLIPAMNKLEGIHRHGSLHAGGVIISNESMHNIAPTYKPKGKGRQVVQYEMMDAESVGLLKMDLLGLKTVTMIDWAEKDVRRLADSDFYTRGHRLDDQEAFNIINAGDTAGIFQLEGTGITRFAQELYVESFNDIVALLALYRPSTLDSGASQQYIDRKNGKEKVDYPHQDLELILKDTYGIMVYQEQVMQTLGIMCGYSMGQADVMRKAMGKKDAKLMEQQLDEFRKFALSPDYGARAYDLDVVEEIARLIETFGRYGFNKSHAVAYSYLTYWCAVMKARYPAMFFNAWLNVTSDGDKQGWIIDQASRKDINILPPDVNKSAQLFTVTDTNTIRFGLSAVKGMGKSFVDKVIHSRGANGDFTSYYEFCKRLTSIPKDKKEALVGAGAFDFDTKYSRAFLYQHARDISDMAKTDKDISTLPPVPDMKPLELGELEKQHVNFYITADPIKNVQKELDMMGGVVGVPVDDLRGEPIVGGRITNVHTLKTKKGDVMAFIDIDDGIVQHSVTLFPNVWKRVSNHMSTNEYTAMKCDIGRYRNKPTLQAIAVFPLDIKNRDVDITVDMGEPTPMQLAQLKMILDGAPDGDSVIDIKVRYKDNIYILRSDLYRIRATDDILGEISGVFGPNCISIKGKST